MKKIPTLFERKFTGPGEFVITDKVTPGCEWVLEGKGVATVKIDGSCCAIIGGKFYKRYDAKGRKKVPAGSIPCCDPDPVTGHWPHWAPVDENNPSDKWFVEAYRQAGQYRVLRDGTYEAIGPHFQGNPHRCSYDGIEPHGTFRVYVERSFDGIRKWLEEHEEEGLVFWLDGEPRCKIKRTDFGLEWPIKTKEGV